MGYLKKEYKMARKKKHDFWDDIDDKEVTEVRERIVGLSLIHI